MRLRDWFSAGPDWRSLRDAPASEADIVHAYRLLLRRDPDPSGQAHWQARVANGVSLLELISTLADSDEYRHTTRDIPHPAPGEHPAPSTQHPAPGEHPAPGVEHPAPSTQHPAPGEHPAPGVEHSAPDTQHPAPIDPLLIIERHTIDALNETANDYYRRVSDPTPLMSKPFAFLHEAPDMLQNLGGLLEGLHLGKTMTVLDFGAGTCWLSRCLAQLNCRPICCDVSPAALEIGRRLFRELPLLGTAVYEPSFLVFDGRRIDLPDASVDRIICFDAFHHVPNPDDVLAEFGRVLKPGGIAGFSEPGRRHSQSAQSQYEMKNHRVLENDVDLERIFMAARAAGFTGMRIKALNDLALVLDEYRLLFDGMDAGDLPSRVWQTMRHTMFNRAIFFLDKGPRQQDSRSHLGLAHVMTTDRSIYEVKPGHALEALVTVTNTGAASWLHKNDEIFGIVRVAAHLYDTHGTLIEVDHFRAPLPMPVAPGETVRIPVTVPLPPSGSYRLVFDLVAEGVTWFENAGSTGVAVDVRR